MISQSGRSHRNVAEYACTHLSWMCGGALRPYHRMHRNVFGILKVCIYYNICDCCDRQPAKLHLLLHAHTASSRQERNTNVARVCACKKKHTHTTHLTQMRTQTPLTHTRTHAHRTRRHINTQNFYFIHKRHSRTLALACCQKKCRTRKSGVKTLADRSCDDRVADHYLMYATARPYARVCFKRVATLTDCCQSHHSECRRGYVLLCVRVVQWV